MPRAGVLGRACRLVDAALGAAFPQAEVIVARDRMSGYQRSTDLHVLVLEVFGAGAPGAERNDEPFGVVVKVGEWARLAPELAAWRDGELRGKQSDPVLMSLRLGCKDEDTSGYGCLIYEGALPALGASSRSSCRRCTTSRCCSRRTPRPATTATDRRSPRNSRKERDARIQIDEARSLLSEAQARIEESDGAYSRLCILVSLREPSSFRFQADRESIGVIRWPRFKRFAARTAPAGAAQPLAGGVLTFALGDLPRSPHPRGVLRRDAPFNPVREQWQGFVGGKIARKSQRRKGTRISHV